MRSFNIKCDGTNVLLTFGKFLFDESIGIDDQSIDFEEEQQ